MSARIAHRGPDDSGLYSFVTERVSVHLAHRRLSIIDVEHGRQPFVRDGLALTYNGELYNYRELRCQLARSGVRFTTSSDTEVVLEAWRRWGPGCLPRFRGMFSLALFVEESGSLYLARDPLGIKPLHYLSRHGGIVFASELKALLHAHGPELRIDAGAMVASLLYYWVPDQRCSIRGVEKLPPGTWAEFRPDGSRRHGRYWDPRAQASEAFHAPEADLRQVIEESVQRHMVADVPVSTFLSGGLDSSVVSVLARKQTSRLDAFTIRFRPEDHRLEAMPDDAVYAARVASRFGMDLHQIEISPDIVDLLPRMVDILDEPIGDPAAINTLLMCNAARQAGVKVILSGMGADEMFGGYRKHVACRLAAQYQRLPDAARAAVERASAPLPVTLGGHGLRYARWAKRFLDIASLPEEPAFRRSYSLYDPSGLEALLACDLEQDLLDLLAEHSHLYWDSDLPDSVSRMCLTDCRYFLPGLNLAYTDRASMAESVEVRVPFVDPAVFSAAFSLRGHRKVGYRQGKKALKEAALAWLPREIVFRPKASFSAPLRAWVRRDLGQVVQDVLVGGELVGCGFLSGPGVARIVEEDRRGREDYSKQIWQLLTLEMWYRRTRSVGVDL